jgi:hypothetical protein
MTTTTTTTPRPLTIPDAVTIADIIRWCQTCARLTWLDDRGDLAHGTARSIGDERGGFAGPTDDVRDCHVRITTAAGWEWFVPMADVIARHRAGTMVQDR